MKHKIKNITRYSIEPKDHVFAKCYVFLSFAKNMSKNIDKSVSKNSSSKCNQKVFDHAKQSGTDALKTG